MAQGKGGGVAGLFFSLPGREQKPGFKTGESRSMHRCVKPRNEPASEQKAKATAATTHHRPLTHPSGAAHDATCGRKLPVQMHPSRSGAM
jgi:hypothetical protein